MRKHDTNIIELGRMSMIHSRFGMPGNSYEVDCDCKLEPDLSPAWTSDPSRLFPPSSESAAEPVNMALFGNHVPSGSGDRGLDSALSCVSLIESNPLSQVEKI